MKTPTEQQSYAPAYCINPDLERTSSAPIQTAKGWGESYDDDADHGPLLSLTQGVPSIPPNEAFMQRLAQAASRTENTSYGSLYGEQSLREALAEDVRGTYGSESVFADNVAITAGCNMAAQVAFQSLARSGDEIILPSPWYFNHEMMGDMLGIRLVPLQCKRNLQGGGFTPSVEDAKALITDRTRAIVLVTPNNPTGSIYSPRLIESFFLLCKEHRIALILDETYRDFLAPSQIPAHHLFSRNDWQTTLISLYSFSKSYSIPGHRVGAIICSSRALQREISKVLDTILICAPVPTQKVLSWAIHDSEQRRWRKDRRDELIERGRLFLQVINAANHTISMERGAAAGGGGGAGAGGEAAECSTVDDDDWWQGYSVDGLGSYYAFLRNPYFDSLGIDHERLAYLLATRVGVVTLPGSFFGQGVSYDPSTGTRRKRSAEETASSSSATTSTATDQHVRVSIANIFNDGIKQIEGRLVALDRLIRQGLR